MPDAPARHAATDQYTPPSPSPESLAEENARLRRQLADQERRLIALHAGLDQLVDEQIADIAALQEVDRRIHAHLDTERVAHAVLDWAIWIASAVAGTLYLVVEPAHPAQDKQLRTVAQRGYPPQAALQQRLHWPTGQDILARALETGRPVHRPEIAPAPGPSRAAPGQDALAHLAVPILLQGQVIGVIGLETGAPQGFTAGQIDSAGRLADHAALAIQNALRHQRITHRLDQVLAVHQAAQALLACHNAAALPGKIVQDATSVLRADRAAFYRPDPSTGEFRRVSTTGRDVGAAPPERALVETAAREGAPQLAGDLQHGTLAALPLVAPNPPSKEPELHGVLYAAFQSSPDLTAESPTPLRLYAAAAALAIHNARQFARLAADLERRQAHVARVLNTTRTPLSAIQGYTKLMLQQIGGHLTARQREFLETILRNAIDLETSLAAASES